MAAEERARAGVFLAFQYPVEIPGVATMQFLKVAMNEQRKARGHRGRVAPIQMVDAIVHVVGHDRGRVDAHGGVAGQGVADPQ